MAETRKNTNKEQYNMDGLTKKKIGSKDKNKNQEKKSLWTKFRVFCNGVKSETKKVHWPNKKDMTKYSVATIVFIVFCSLFFYLIDVIFALIQALFN